MLYAYDLHSLKIRATPSIQGFCPECNEPLISRCGDINVWHFAHKVNFECEYKPDSTWSLEWKLYFPSEAVEIRKNNRVADLILSNDLVVEFQHSSISLSDMIEKTKYWQKIVWIFDLSKSNKNFYICNNLKGGRYFRTSLIDEYSSCFEANKDSILATGFLLYQFLDHVNLSCIYIPMIEWMWQSRTHSRFLKEIPDGIIIYDLSNDLMLLRLNQASIFDRFFSGIIFKKSDFVQVLFEKLGTPNGA